LQKNCRITLETTRETESQERCETARMEKSSPGFKVRLE
jgi:hypothetical protein